MLFGIFRKVHMLQTMFRLHLHASIHRNITMMALYEYWYTLKFVGPISDSSSHGLLLLIRESEELYAARQWNMASEKENEMKQQCTEAEMKTIEWMCGVKLKDKLSCVELIQRLEIQRFIWISEKMDVLWRGGCYMYMQAKDKMEWVSLGILWDADVYGKWRRSD